MFGEIKEQIKEQAEVEWLPAKPEEQVPPADAEAGAAAMEATASRPPSHQSTVPPGAAATAAAPAPAAQPSRILLLFPADTPTIVHPFGGTPPAQEQEQTAGEHGEEHTEEHDEKQPAAAATPAAAPAEGSAKKGQKRAAVNSPTASPSNAGGEQARSSPASSTRAKGGRPNLGGV